MKTVVSKPNGLDEERRWIRLSEAIEQYPIKESTMFDWRTKGIIKQWKKVSARVTIYDKWELEELFNPSINNNCSVEEVKIITSSTKKRRKRIKPRTKLEKSNILKKTLTSEEKVTRYNEQMDDYARKVKLRKKRRTRIAKEKEFNAPIVMPKAIQHKPFTQNKEGLLRGVKS